MLICCLLIIGTDQTSFMDYTLQELILGLGFGTLDSRCKEDRIFGITDYYEYTFLRKS